MKTLRDYITESETWMHTPAEGDSFAIELADGTLIESYIFELADDSILLDATPEIVSVLESWNLLSDQESDDAVILETMGYGTMVGEEDVDESWKSKLAGAALAGAAMLGGAGAHAGGVSIGPDGQPDLKGFTAQQQQTMNQKMSQQRDLGDGFAQTTVKFAGRDLPAVVDTESGTYITLNRNPEGYAILRTPAKYILIKDGKPQAANDLGPATMQALQKAGLIDAQPGVKEAKYHGREEELDEINRRGFLGALGVGAATAAGLMPTDAEACRIDDIPYINEILDKHKEMMASNPRYEREVRKSIPDVDEWIKKRTRCIGPDAGQVEVSKKLRPILEKYGVVIKAKQSSNEGEMDEGIFDRFKKTTKKESYSRQEFYQWLDQVQKQIAQGEDIDEVIYNLESSLEKTYTDDVVEQVKSQIWDSLDLEMDEAKYHGREVPLGKPMAGDVKKSKVYVRDPSTGNIKKVNFGDPNMRIKKSSPGHRKSFRARHHCENPGPRTKARYWSCRAW